MVIIGFDPGLAILGYGVIESDGVKSTAIDYGIITTPTEMPFPQRLVQLHSGVTKLIESHRPHCIGFEELFFGRNVKTAISVGQARGAALVAAASLTDQLYEFTPMQIKKAITGNGHTDKKGVQYMVALLLGLKAPPKPDDAADALAVALGLAHILHAGGSYKIQ